MIDFLGRELVNSHLGVLDSIRKIREGAAPSAAEQDRLNSVLAESSEEIVNHFGPGAKEEPPKIDAAKPTILLTSLRGCKGLSAGHVFIVGSHDRSLPRDSDDVQDVEIAQFIVALTRTRKQCHIISNRWLVAPVDRKGNSVAPNKPSRFVSWIPKAMIDNRGTFKANDFRVHS
jgi:superfamily I DNA/RNA helicase